MYIENPISEATSGKHIRGIPLYHMKDGKVRWRFVACELNLELREDNHQGTPPLMIVRAIVSRAGSAPDEFGQHRRMIRIWDVRKAFFNAELDEIIYVHPGKELCKPGYCWWLRKAMNGTRKASQLWGETVRAVMDDGSWITLASVPNAWYKQGSDRKDGLSGDDRKQPRDDATAVCHGDDVIAEGYPEDLEELDLILS